MDPSLTVAGVVKRFGALRAVDDVSFTLGRGEICGLVGPNGSGKSTLLNVISAVLPATSGTVIFDGHTLTGSPAHVAARYGVRRTFQLLRLLRGQTVLENVLVGQYLGDADRSLFRALALTPKAKSIGRESVESAMRVLHDVGIAEYADELVENLTFGVQRKVELARAMVGRPRLLLLDEPASGLDEHGTADLAAHVRRAAADGTIVLLVDHHLEFIVDLCPRVLVMNYGRLIFDGKGDDALKDATVQEAYIGG